MDYEEVTEPLDEEDRERLELKLRTLAKQVVLSQAEFGGNLIERLVNAMKSAIVETCDLVLQDKYDDFDDADEYDYEDE